MEIKLTDNQKNALIDAYDNFLMFENIDIQKGLNIHLGKINILPEEIDTLEEFIFEGEQIAQDIFDWDERPEYFKTMDTILNKLKDSNLDFNDKEMYNLRNVTDLYPKLGQGQIRVLRDVYSNIKNVNIGGFVSLTNVFDKANKIITEIPIKKTKEEYKIVNDIHQVIRNYLAWKRKPEGGSHPDFDKPIKYSKEPLPYLVTEQQEIEFKSKRSNKPKSGLK